jgi:hypothetical protein
MCDNMPQDHSGLSHPSAGLTRALRGEARVGDVLADRRGAMKAVSGSRAPDEEGYLLAGTEGSSNFAMDQCRRVRRYVRAASSN